MSEGSGENLFMVKKRQAHHPAPARPSILEGVTRDTILTLAREEGIPTAEEMITPRPALHWRTRSSSRAPPPR